MPTAKLPEQLTVAIFCRDGACCVYCGASKTDGALISVDHLIARSWGGNETDVMNLVCSCKPCNDAKGNMDHIAFADMVERYAPTLPALARFGANPKAAITVARVNAHRLAPLNPIATEAALERLRAARRKK